jgi:hypothetical protein
MMGLKINILFVKDGKIIILVSLSPNWFVKPN